jgi:hypothetical protein
MISFSHDPLHSLGFHYKDNYSENESTKIFVHNLANVVGYLPIIGTIVGLVRMIFTLYNIFSNDTLENEQKEFYRAQIYRGSVEFLSLGIMFIVSDIIVTRARNLDPQFLF